MLAHAEVEHCIEDLALEAAQRMLSKWKTDQVARPVLQGLLAHADPKDLSDAWFKQLPEFRYENVVQRFTRVVEDNMGIKASTVLRLLLSVGLPRADIVTFG